jgi:hypothetical protein
MTQLLISYVHEYLENAPMLEFPRLMQQFTTARADRSQDGFR